MLMETKLGGLTQEAKEICANFLAFWEVSFTQMHKF